MKRKNPEWSDLGYTYEEYAEATKHARKKALKARSEQDSRDKIKGVERWSHTGRRFPVRVFAAKKVAGFNIQLGRHADENNVWYALRIPNLLSGWFWATKTKAAAKSSYRSIKSKKSLEEWANRHSP